jgi:hypothetical protein
MRLLYHKVTSRARNKKHLMNYLAVVVFSGLFMQLLHINLLVHDVAYANSQMSSSAQSSSALSDLPSCTKNKISINKLDTVQLISETGSIPLTITNDLDRDVVLKLDATSEDSNRLEVWGLDQVFVRANSEQKVVLPIHARANGIVTITTHLKSRNLDFGKMSFGVHITRAVGDVLSAVFYTLIALLLLLGIFRTIRIHRRLRSKLPEQKQVDN